MPPRPIELHPEAIAEAQAAVRWYRQRSESAAVRFVEEMDAAVDRVAASPQRGAPFAEGVRRILLHRFPFAVIYQEKADVIEIIAVAHGKRKPGYWRGR